MTRLLFSIALLLSFQCRDVPEDDAPSMKVLFVGNSLTYVNDLPSLVVEIAAMNGEKISVETVALPDYSIDDHLNDGEVQLKLKNGKYDFLVAQQGPSALPESQAILKASAINLASSCEANKTKFALYMVWPSKARSFDLDNSIASYTNAATASGALLCPAGLAWKKAWAVDPMFPLYGSDQFHPSTHGSLLAAMVIYASIKGLDNVDFVTAQGSWKGTVSNAQLEVMKRAVVAL